MGFNQTVKENYEMLTKRNNLTLNQKLDLLGITGSICLAELEHNAQVQRQCGDYHILGLGNKLSRPIKPGLLIRENFKDRWDEMICRLGTREYLSDDEITRFDKLIYTNIMSYCVYCDLWKGRDIKTPGTYFEVLIRVLMSHFYPGVEISTKGIPVPDSAKEKITTDMILSSPNSEKALVIPAKITTRERVVQAFAHQFLLQKLFHEKYRSVLVCVSEMQRDRENNVKETCVPNTVTLYQTHLTELIGMLYLDPPERYQHESVTSRIPIRTFCSLFTPFIGDYVRECISGQGQQTLNSF